MKSFSISISAGLITCMISILVSCNNPVPVQQTTEPAKKELSQSEMIDRGNYLVVSGHCNDCHSPKKFTPEGPVPDSTRLLSGHPAGNQLPPIYKDALKPGNWVIFAPDFTAIVGPWGISYTANLTPDSATGIGAWTEDIFIRTLRTGKHLGQAGGRQILPPMPWQEVGSLSDEDLKSIFAFLRALPPISNRVPAPVSPADVAKMK